MDYHLHAVPVLEQDRDSDSGFSHSTLVDAEVPVLSSDATFPSSRSSDVTATIQSLRERFICTHTLSKTARKRHEQTRDHPDRIHPADKHVLPPDPESLPLQEQIRMYITMYHMADIRRALADSVKDKIETGATIPKYVIRVQVDPVILLETCSSLGNQVLDDIGSVEPEFHMICCQLLQFFLGQESILLYEQVRLSLRLSYLPTAAQDCFLPSISAALTVTREDRANNTFVSFTGRVASTSLSEYVIYSQTFICTNSRCNNHDYLHHRPRASSCRVIKRTEDGGFMETGTNATLLKIDLNCSHCGQEMPESVLDRVYMKEQKLEVVCDNGVEQSGCFIHQLPIVLQDDLANRVSLGEQVRIIGRLYRSVPKSTANCYHHGVKVEVNNIWRLDQPPSTVPPLFVQLLRRQTSGWNMSQAIVDLIVLFP
ncbi:hypothetical protein EMPS_09362 [Entomortierella parvispora]|uniref:MCMDC2 N-terminal domain-containing protein n=1 Tax=Entomortierella parvispora TaxID=205924 RepID=A0A9P3M083_9FUNG|nr:hypothetical protein EMPS_09362 [Entomortierella parvispora]